MPASQGVSFVIMFFGWLPDMWTTQRDDRFYWHIRVHEEGGRYAWDRKRGVGRVDVTQDVLAER
jgi:hypothetical protein